MRIVKVKDLKKVPNEYGYQLTEVVPDLWEILPLLMQFKKYGDKDSAILVSLPEGYVIMTKGDRRQEDKKEKEQEDELRRKIMMEIVTEDTYTMAAEEIIIHGTTDNETQN